VSERISCFILSETPPKKMDDLDGLISSPEVLPKMVNYWDREDTKEQSPLETRMTSSANAR
jgi:hypothetical protein